MHDLRVRSVATPGGGVTEEIYRWRPLPPRQRCERCTNTASVLLDDAVLCGDCFLAESRRRYCSPAPLKPQLVPYRPEPESTG